MEDLVLLDAVERYLNGEMNQQEKENFEALRRQSPEVDQLVVEHQMFVQQLANYGSRREFKHQLHTVHNELLQAGAISETVEASKGAVVLQFWKKYKRTIAVAASIAGITAITISLGTHLLTPQNSSNDLQQLGRKMTELESKTNEQNRKLNQLITREVKSPMGPQKSGGTSFLIDGDGYLVTNAHVVNGATTLIVVNGGREYIAKKVHTDLANDLAILKIEDKDWKPVGKLPYGLRKSNVDLGEEIFTLGYPRNEVVYNRGYMSARSGFNDDTLSIQIAISANPGNSGGPLFDRNGDIIGVLSTRDKQANDVVFATKTINICKAIEDLKKDSSDLKLKMASSTGLKGVERSQQLKKIQDCVFMVKGY